MTISSLFITFEKFGFSAYSFEMSKLGWHTKNDNDRSYRSLSLFPRWPSLLQQNKSRLGHVQEKELYQNQWWWWWWGSEGLYQYSGAGYITVSSRTQDRNTPSARTHRTHGRTHLISNTHPTKGKNILIALIFSDIKCIEVWHITTRHLWSEVWHCFCCGSKQYWI